jgi:hypothetical protein
MGDDDGWMDMMEGFSLFDNDEDDGWHRPLCLSIITHSARSRLSPTVERSSPTKSPLDERALQHTSPHSHLPQHLSGLPSPAAASGTQTKIVLGCVNGKREPLIHVQTLHAHHSWLTHSHPPHSFFHQSWSSSVWPVQCGLPICDAAGRARACVCGCANMTRLPLYRDLLGSSLSHFVLCHVNVFAPPLLVACPPAWRV